MKTLRLYALVFLVSTGCSSFEKEMPLPPSAAARAVAEPSPFPGSFAARVRDVASTAAYVQSSYNSYFSGQNFYQRLAKLENLTARLHAVMPDKGHPKKNLVGRFLTDLQRERAALPATSGDDRALSWMPSAGGASYSEKIQALGRVAASYRIMTRMGIYLTASGVFDEDSADEDFYLSLLDRATGDIESGLRGLVLVYKPEDRERDEAVSRLSYAGTLASGVRLALPRAYPDRGVTYRRLDGFFQRLEAAARSGGPDPAPLRALLRSAEGRAIGRTLKELHVMNSGDILGFRDEMDLTISTKFGYEMIRQLADARGGTP